MLAFYKPKMYKNVKDCGASERAYISSYKSAPYKSEGMVTRRLDLVGSCAVKLFLCRRSSSVTKRI